MFDSHFNQQPRAETTVFNDLTPTLAVNSCVNAYVWQDKLWNSVLFHVQDAPLKKKNMPHNKRETEAPSAVFVLTCLDLAWAAVGPFFLKTVTVSQSLSAIFRVSLDTRNV